MNRLEVFDLINGERAYQEAQENAKGWQKKKTVGEWIVLMNYYTAKLNEAWCVSTGDQSALAVMRKLAGIAVHCAARPARNQTVAAGSIRKHSLSHRQQLRQQRQLLEH